MKIQHRSKIKIIDFCRRELNEAELKAERDSITLIEAYKKAEKHTYRSIETGRQRDQEPDYDTQEQNLEQLQTKLHSDLFDIEINLQEALTAARKTFVNKINDILQVQKDLTQNYVTNDVMGEIETFCQKFIDAAQAERDRIDKQLEAFGDEEPDEAFVNEFEPEFLQFILLGKEEVV